MRSDIGRRAAVAGSCGFHVRRLTLGGTIFTLDLPPRYPQSCEMPLIVDANGASGTPCRDWRPTATRSPQPRARNGSMETLGKTGGDLRPHVKEQE
jgi:hypothetical protein